MLMIHVQAFGHMLIQTVHVVHVVCCLWVCVLQRVVMRSIQGGAACRRLWSACTGGWLCTPSDHCDNVKCKAQSQTRQRLQLMCRLRDLLLLAALKAPT